MILSNDMIYVCQVGLDHLRPELRGVVLQFRPLKKKNVDDKYIHLFDGLTCNKRGCLANKVIRAMSKTSAHNKCKTIKQGIYYSTIITQSLDCLLHIPSVRLPCSTV